MKTLYFSHVNVEYNSDTKELFIVDPDDEETMAVFKIEKGQRRKDLDLLFGGEE